MEKDFGTGILKITPAHDRLDFEIAQRHDLPMIDILNPDGTLNELAGGDFVGMDRFRPTERGQNFPKTATCSTRRSIKTTSDIQSGRAYPSNRGCPSNGFSNTRGWRKQRRRLRTVMSNSSPRDGKDLLAWLENIQDWCISRQLWWGIGFRSGTGKGAVRSDPANWRVSATGPSDPEKWEQDEGVWIPGLLPGFGLWPTLGWPGEAEMEKKAFDHFYPTSTSLRVPTSSSFGLPE